MEYTELLRRLAINDEGLAEALISDPGLPGGGRAVDAKTLALARIAALVAVGGAEPSYGSLADAAVNAGATAAEMVDVMVAIITVVGVHRVVAAAPKLAAALGHDPDEWGRADGRASSWRG